MTTPATTPAVTAQQIEQVMELVRDYRRASIRELSEVAADIRAALMALATPSPGKAPEPVVDTSDEDAYVIDRLGGMLADIAIVLKGPEEALHHHSYHDLVETATVMKLELDLYRATYGETLASPGKAEAERERDAERYRFLRKAESRDDLMHVLITGTPEELDSDVDRERDKQ